MSKLFYQPALTREELNCISIGDWNGLAGKFPIFRDPNPRSERACIDRLEMIVSNLGIPIIGLSVLDLGCSNGFFVNTLAHLGALPCLGVDNSVHNITLAFTDQDVIVEAQRAAEDYGVKNRVSFIDEDFIRGLGLDKYDKYDAVIFFSVFHHLFEGYGSKNINVLGNELALDVLHRIDSITKKYLFFEMCEQTVVGWNRETIPSLLLRNTTFKQCKQIGVSEDGWNPRAVFMLTR